MNQLNKILIPTEVLYKISSEINRNSAKEQGFYDGRFATKTFESKKKAIHQKFRKKKIKINEIYERL